jgi:hypothetical protein
MVTKNEGGREGHSSSGSVRYVAIEGYFKFERVETKNVSFYLTDI